MGCPSCDAGTPCSSCQSSSRQPQPLQQTQALQSQQQPPRRLTKQPARHTANKWRLVLPSQMSRCSWICWGSASLHHLAFRQQRSQIILWQCQMRHSLQRSPCLECSAPQRPPCTGKSVSSADPRKTATNVFPVAHICAHMQQITQCCVYAAYMCRAAICMSYRFAHRRLRLTGYAAISQLMIPIVHCPRQATCLPTPCFPAA